MDHVTAEPGEHGLVRGSGRPSRRGFLRGAAGLGVSAAGLALAGCASTDTQKPADVTEAKPVAPSVEPQKPEAKPPTVAVPPKSTVTGDPLDPYNPARELRPPSV